MAKRKAPRTEKKDAPQPAAEAPTPQAAWNRVLKEPKARDVAAYKPPNHTPTFIILGVLLLALSVIIYVELGRIKADGVYVPIRDEPQGSASGYVPPAVQEPEPLYYSFADQVADRDSLNGKTVSVIGRLEHVVELVNGSGVHRYSLMDDVGTRAPLTKLSARLLPVFPEDGISERFYNVTGFYRRTYTGFTIDVKSITNAETPLP